MLGTAVNGADVIIGDRLTSRDESILVGSLCVTFGVITFDMIGVNYLIPFIVPALRLTNFQVGVVVSAFWITFAVAGSIAGVITDKWRNRKSLLVAAVSLFAGLSIVSGLVNSFLTLVAARLVMGLVQGLFLPPAQTILAMESSPHRRGLNMGLLQNVGSSFAAFLCPLVLVYIAQAYNWRLGFFLVAIPGALCAAAIGRFVREPAQSRLTVSDAPDMQEHGIGLRQLLTFRNVWLCTALTALFNAEVTIGHGFLPLYYTQIVHMSPAMMSILMSILGLSGACLGIVLPALSDRAGRKPVVIVAAGLGILCPVGSLYCHGSLSLLMILMFLGWAPAGASAIYSATILSETVPPALIGTAFGLVLASGTLCGSLSGPIAGWAADLWGLSAPVAIEAACCVAMVAIACALRETAPARSLAAATLPRS